MRNFAVTAAALLFISSPAQALTCATDSLEHVTIKKSQRKKIDRTLQNFFNFVDSIDLYAASLDSASLEFQGTTYPCESKWRVLEMTCGPIQLKQFGMVGHREKERLKIPSPLNAAYPFDYAN